MLSEPSACTCREKSSRGEDAEGALGGGVARTDDVEERGRSGAEDVDAGTLEEKLECCLFSDSRSRSLIGPSDGPITPLLKGPRPFMWELGVLLRCLRALGDIRTGWRPYSILSLKREQRKTFSEVTYGLILYIIT